MTPAHRISFEDFCNPYLLGPGPYINIILSGTYRPDQCGLSTLYEELNTTSLPQHHLTKDRTGDQIASLNMGLRSVDFA